MPLVTPVVLITWAIASSVLLHVPPADVSLRVIEAPWHTLSGPVIAPDPRLTLTGAVVRHPVTDNW